MPKLQTLLALDRADRIAAIEAVVALIYFKAAVSSVAPRHWRSRFGHVGRDRSAGSPGQDIATIRRVRLAIERGLRNVPGAPNCLPQALAARMMLERRGIASDLFIGTRPAAGSGLKFHAWLKVGEEWVTGLCDEDAYSLFIAGDAEAA